jgi:tRNA pseudouridine-54 N-methylase
MCLWVNAVFFISSSVEAKVIIYLVVISQRINRKTIEDFEDMTRDPPS